MLHRLALAVSIALLAASVAQAQQKSSGEVSGVGASTLTLRPKVLRVHVELLGRGKDLKSAMASLKDRRDAVKIQLGTLKADMKSVTIGPPVKAGVGGPQEQQMRAMILQRARQKGGAAPSLPTVVTLSAPLTVEWTLTGDDEDARVVAAEELCDKITAADLGGAKDKQQLSPEQQEIQEELGQMNYGYSEGQNPGEPLFLFIAEVSDEDATKALTEAFANAKKEAERYAKAVGGELGALKKVEKSWEGAEGFDAGDHFHGNRMIPMAMARQMQTGAVKKNEVIAQDPNRAIYRTSIACGFEVR